MNFQTRLSLMMISLLIVPALNGADGVSPFSDQVLTTLAPSSHVVESASLVKRAELLGVSVDEAAKCAWFHPEMSSEDAVAMVARTPVKPSSPTKHAIPGSFIVTCQQPFSIDAPVYLLHVADKPKSDEVMPEIKALVITKNKVGAFWKVGSAEVAATSLSQVIQAAQKEPVDGLHVRLFKAKPPVAPRRKAVFSPAVSSTPSGPVQSRGVDRSQVNSSQSLNQFQIAGYRAQVLTVLTAMEKYPKEIALWPAVVEKMSDAKFMLLWEAMGTSGQKALNTSGVNLKDIFPDAAQHILNGQAQPSANASSPTRKVVAAVTSPSKLAKGASANTLKGVRLINQKTYQGPINSKASDHPKSGQQRFKDVAFALFDLGTEWQDLFLAAPKADQLAFMKAVRLDPRVTDRVMTDAELAVIFPLDAREALKKTERKVAKTFEVKATELQKYDVNLKPNNDPEIASVTVVGITGDQSGYATLMQQAKAHLQREGQLESGKIVVFKFKHPRFAEPLLVISPQDMIRNGLTNDSFPDNWENLFIPGAQGTPLAVSGKAAKFIVEQIDPSPLSIWTQMSSAQKSA